MKEAKSKTGKSRRSPRYNDHVKIISSKSQEAKRKKGMGYAQIADIAPQYD